MGILPLTYKSKLKYLELLHNKIWKLLPISEEQEEIVFRKQLKTVLDDLNSANDLFDGAFIDIIVKLNAIYIIKLE